MKRVHRTPVRTLDRDGRQIVLVPLANHDQPAKLFAEDWDRLMREGISPQWTFNMGRDRAYVRCSAKRAGN